MEGYEFGLLGPLNGRHDGRVLDLGSPLQRAVLVRLLLGEGRQCGLDHLIDALWEEPPGNAVRSVQTYVYRIRLSLGEERSRLETTQGGYQLGIPEQAVDALRFERLVRDGEELRAARQTAPALRAFDAALALWSGEPLSGVPGPYARRHRGRFVDLRLNAQVAQLSCADELGEHARVATELIALIADHPLREDLYALRMRALYHAGRAAEALAVYAAARETMVAELGMDPGPELRELQTRILSGAEPDAVEPSTGGQRAGATASTSPTASAGAPADIAATRSGGEGQPVESGTAPETDRSTTTRVEEAPVGVRPQQLPRRPATSSVGSGCGSGSGSRCGPAGKRSRSRCSAVSAAWGRQRSRCASPTPSAATIRMGSSMWTCGATEANPPIPQTCWSTSSSRSACRPPRSPRRPPPAPVPIAP